MKQRIRNDDSKEVSTDTRSSANLDRLESASLPKLVGDGRRFKQVLMNIVKNAIKFTKRG